MPIRAVIFDIGGVLENTPETGWHVRWEQRLGFPLEEIERRLTALGLDGGLGTCTEEAWLDGLREVTGLEQTQVDAFMADLWEEYLGTLNAELTAYCAALRPGVKTGIISNSLVGAGEREQALYHFEAMTDDIVYSHEVGLAKPDPRIYELACRRLGVEPAEVVFVDDHEEMLVPARALGMLGVLFIDTQQTIAAIEAALKTG